MVYAMAGHGAKKPAKVPAKKPATSRKAAVLRDGKEDVYLMEPMRISEECNARPALTDLVLELGCAGFGASAILNEGQQFIVDTDNKLLEGRSRIQS